jgi:hypothetical protein
MNFKTSLFILVVHALSFSGTLADSGVIANKVRNIWQYEYRSGGKTGGKTYLDFRYTAKVESSSGILLFKEYKNDSLKNTDTLKIRKDPLDGSKYKAIINLKLLTGTTTAIDEGFYVRFPTDTTMVLDEGCCDRYAFYFKVPVTGTKNPATKGNSMKINFIHGRTIYGLSGKREALRTDKISTGIYLEKDGNYQITAKRMTKLRSD